MLRGSQNAHGFRNARPRSGTVRGRDSDGHPFAASQGPGPSLGAMDVVLFVLMLLIAAPGGLAWKWRSLFDDSDGDSVVTVAADGRGVYHPTVVRAYG